MLKILFLTHCSELGGAEIVLTQLLERLKRFNFKLVVPKHGMLSSNASRRGIPVAIVKISDKILNIRRTKIVYNPIFLVLYLNLLIVGIVRLVNFVRKESFGLIFANSTKSHIYGSLVGKLTGVPIVWRVHDIVSKKTFEPLIIKLIVLVANLFPYKILCVSNAVKEALLIHGVRKGKLLTIYNGIDTKIFNPNIDGSPIREEFKIKKDTIVIGMIGRLTFWKGQELFLKAAAKISHNYPNTVFLIVGSVMYEDNNYKEKLKNIALTYNILNRVIFTGFRKDIPEIISAMDILIHFSILPDPLPTVLLEAMAMKKPVVAANIGGVPEIIEDGKNGILVSPGDWEKLAEVIIELLRDKKKMETLGTNAYNKVKKHFSIDAYVNAMSKVLEECKIKLHDDEHLTS